jgi:predicted Fe-Mo cluster-binding NifX family protein
MKVAVSASSPSLESPVDPRFGRCAYFVVVDPDTMLFETVDNTNALSSQGAGIGTAQTVAQLGATVVLTGNCGPNAFQALEAAGIEVVTGVSGSVREAVEGFKAGHYRSSTASNVESHYGMGLSGTMGRGMGGAMSATPPQASPADSDSALLGLLKELQGQLEGLRSQVNDINQRIDRLHKEQ